MSSEFEESGYSPKSFAIFSYSKIAFELGPKGFSFEDNLNIDGQLRVGMSVSVTIDTEHESEIPIIIRPFATIFKLLRD